MGSVKVTKKWSPPEREEEKIILYMKQKEPRDMRCHWTPNHPAVWSCACPEVPRFPDACLCMPCRPGQRMSFPVLWGTIPHVWRTPQQTGPCSAKTINTSLLRQQAMSLLRCPWIPAVQPLQVLASDTEDASISQWVRTFMSKWGLCLQNVTWEDCFSGKLPFPHNGVKILNCTMKKFKTQFLTLGCWRPQERDRC